MAVVNASGLVGIIDETYPDASRVLLITSPRDVRLAVLFCALIHVLLVSLTDWQAVMPFCK